MIEPFKIKVESESHSREIQEWIFSLEYSWCCGSTNVIILHAKYLFFSKDEGCEDPTIGWSSCPKGFKESDLPEMWFYDGKLQDKPQPQTESHPYIRTYRQVVEAILSGKNLQHLETNGNWIPITYLELDVRLLDSQYPRKVRVTPRICNGEELDPCLTEYPEKGSYYYYPDPMHVDFYGMKLWVDDADDHYWFELGFAYSSSESAAKHGQAMGRYI